MGSTPTIQARKNKSGKEKALFVYHLPAKEKSKRVRFVYAMKGRAGEDGIVSAYKGEFIAPACFLVPWGNAKAVQEVFALWGIRYLMMRITVGETVNTLSKIRK